MGTDIDLTVEFRTEAGWREAKGLRYISRHYDLFDAMADGRGNGRYKALAPSRGFPKDSTREIFEYEYAKSWFTLAEALGHTFPPDPEWEKLMDEASKLGSPEDVRFLVSFNN